MSFVVHFLEVFLGMALLVGFVCGMTTVMFNSQKAWVAITCLMLIFGVPIGLALAFLLEFAR
jgi:hypothetical protein